LSATRTARAIPFPIIGISEFDPIPVVVMATPSF
jgi:hypothetical protein